jgi:energy-converting hydrogenase Eha subunit A
MQVTVSSNIESDLSRSYRALHSTECIKKLSNFSIVIKLVIVKEKKTERPLFMQNILHTTQLLIYGIGSISINVVELTPRFDAICANGYVFI